MTVLVCDDHPLIRSALAAVVAQAAQGERVLAARDYTEACLFASENADLTLCVVDLYMPGAAPYDGLSELRRQAPSAKLVVVTGSDSDEELAHALRFGVDGFVPKTAEPGVTEAAIRLVLAGGRYFPPRALEVDLGAWHAQAPERPASQERLGERQRQVLHLLAAGRSNKEIAETLSLSPATVKAHVAHIFAVLGVTNRTEAAMHARKKGLD